MSSTTDNAWTAAGNARKLLDESMAILRTPAGVERIRSELATGDRALALFLLPHLRDLDIETLLPELVFLASFSHGSIVHVRQTIRRLPAEVLTRDLPGLMERHLDEAEEYRRFLELLSEIDPALCLALSRRAIASPDPEIKEIGLEFTK